jgi:DNA-directed RNA polymerase subunit RPC12/RpoP
METKIKVQCTRCRLPFRERASQVKEGNQAQCPNCNRLITYSTDSADSGVRKAKTEARRIRYGVPALARLCS